MSSSKELQDVYTTKQVFGSLVTASIRQTTLYTTNTSTDDSDATFACQLCSKGGILALHAHCTLLLDYVPPEELQSTPLGNTLRIRRPNLDWRGP